MRPEPEASALPLTGINRNGGEPEIRNPKLAFDARLLRLIIASADFCPLVNAAVAAESRIPDFKSEI